jgi:uncharacterized membrane-anchored protein
MKHLSLLLFLSFCLFKHTYAQKEDSISKADLEYIQKASAFEKSIDYKRGKVDLSEKIELNIPSGYKFIPKKDSEKIIFQYWGNPPSDGILGMLVLEKFQFLASGDWAFVLSEETEGYVNDEDAGKINYDDLLKELQDAEPEQNEERKKAGFGAITTVGWASKPFYDQKAKILHWAKELKFEGSPGENTLNYDVRILGRSGLLSMNAVGSMSNLDSVKKHIPKIINIAKFKAGHTYFDFDPSVDKVAAYTIGGLVAGKLLAKAGFLVFFLKYIKIILLAAAGGFSLFKNKIMGLFGKKKEEGSIESKSEE